MGLGLPVRPQTITQDRPMDPWTQDPRRDAGMMNHRSASTELRTAAYI